MNLIIPAAGKSTRFPDLKPKWLLTHPDGNLMIISALTGLDLDKYENIYVTILQEHLEKHANIEGVQEAFKEVGIVPKILVLKEETKSQPETVYETIVQNKIKGSIFIKDVDNYFKDSSIAGNYVCTYNLNDLEFVNASNKSYVSSNDEGVINNIIEKEIISQNFCVGGYSFEAAEQFVKYYQKQENSPSLYISHIIFDMILDGCVFNSREVADYCDWGTKTEWNKYKSQFATIFIDIDGVLFKNASRFFPPMWGTSEPLIQNIGYLKRLYSTNKVHIVLTTSRKRKECYENTISQLDFFGIKYHDIVFDLPHCKRIIINDFATSNPYRSCDSINLIRDDDNMESYFKENFEL